MKDYPTEGAAPKDALAKIICREIKEGRGTEHGGVWLDLTGLPEDEIKVNHSLYYERFIREGIDLTKECVEVAPAAHSMMGGVEVDTDCAAAVPGLFAAGEVMGGLHGANRLGGNAGAEVYVFGSICGKSAAHYAGSIPGNDGLNDAPEVTIDSGSGCMTERLQDVIDAVREKLGTALSPLREGWELREALAFVEACSDSLEKMEKTDFESAGLLFAAKNVCLLGKLMLVAALERKESRGVHGRVEFPESDDAFAHRSIRFSKANGTQFA